MEEHLNFRSSQFERRHSFKQVEMEKHPSFKIGLMEKQRSFRFPSSRDRPQSSFLRPPSIVDKQLTTTTTSLKPSPVKKKNNGGAKRGDTPLHIAARIHDMSKLRELLHCQDEDGVRQMVSCQNQIGETCLYVASENGHADVVREILIHSDYQSAALKANNGFDSFQIAARQGHLGVLKELLHSFPELAMTTNSVNSTALDTAATQGHIEIVDLLLDSNIPDLAKIARTNGKTALHSAARGGHAEIVRSLLVKDPTIMYRRDRKGQTAFHMAVKGASADVFWELLKPEPTSIINLEDNKGNTALHIATRKGRPQVVRDLVSIEGVEINKINKSFETALDIATKSNHDEIISLLKDAGGLVAKEHASPPPISPAKELKETVSDIKHDLQSQFQHTQKTKQRVNKIKKNLKKLQFTGLNNAMNSNTIVAVLIATIAFAAIFTLPAQNIQKSTTASDAAGYTLGQAYIATSASFVVFFVFDSLSLFISLSVVVVQTSLIVTEEKAKTLMVFVINKLMWLACVFMSIAFISLTFIVVGRHNRWLAWATAGIGSFILLITIGSMCFFIIKHHFCKDTRSILRRFSISRSPSSVDVESGSELVVREKVMAFLNAARTGNVNDLKKFGSLLDEEKNGLEKTAADVKDGNKRTALHFAAREGKVEMCRYLLEKLNLDVDVRDEDGETPLVHAARQGHVNTAKYLLQKGANHSSASEMGICALHHACGLGNIELMELLVSKDSDMNLPSDAGTPLIWAAGHGKEDAVKFLLEHNANPNCATDDGITPLLSAVAAGSLLCVELLIQAGAATNISAGGATALNIASDNGDRKIIECLLKGGADANIPDEDGMKPIQVAALRNNKAVVEILLPLTSPIEGISDWTVDGLIEYTKREEMRKEGDSKETEMLSKLSLQKPETVKVTPEAKARSLEAKLRGQDAFKRKDFASAVDAYTQAIDLDPNEAIFLSNRSLCWLRMGQPERALTDAQACRALRPDWAKACYREGASLYALQRFEEAANAFYEGVKLDPDNKEMVDSFREAVEAGRKFHGTTDKPSNPHT